MNVVRTLHLSTILLTFLTVAVGRLSAQTWHPTPDRLTLECKSMATPDDSTVICANSHGLLRIDLSRDPQLGSYIYEANNAVTGLWARDSVILIVDGSGNFLGNRLMRSSDYGRTWDEVNILEFPIQPYTLNSDQSGRLFLGCTFATILMSEDEGRTWSYFHQFSPLSTFQYMVPNSIDMHPDGAVVSVVDIALKEARGANRWFRKDESGSWIDISFQENVDRMDEWEIVRLDETRLAGLEADRLGRFRLHLSSDNGETWSMAEGGEPVYMFPGIGRYLYVDRDEGWLYVCRTPGSNTGYGPLHVSRDFGKSFELIGGENKSYGLARGTDGRVWAMFWEYGKHSLWRENDDRTELELILGPYSLGVSYAMTEMSIRSLTASLDPRGGVWFALVEGGGVWRTLNSGRSWAPLESRDWDSANCLASGPDGAVYIGSDLGIARLDDYSLDSWDTLTSGFGVTTMAIVSDHGLIAETRSGKVVRIDPDGTTDTINPAGGNGTARLLTVDRYDRVVVADSLGLYLIPNFLNRWVRIGDSTMSSKAISFCSVDGNNLMVGTDDGAYLSRDAGQSWAPSGLENRRVERLVTTDAKQVYYPISVVVPRIVAQTGDTLWSSTDTGRTWTDISELLPEGAITALTVDNNGSLVAGISGYGVYWQDYLVILSVDPLLPSTPSVSVVTYADGEIEVEVRQGQVEVQNVSVAMVDLLGREVEGEAVVWKNQSDNISIRWKPATPISTVLLGRITCGGSSYSFKTVLKR